MPQISGSLKKIYFFFLTFEKFKDLDICGIKSFLKKKFFQFEKQKKLEVIKIRKRNIWEKEN